jgi:hypothetical protein
MGVDPFIIGPATNQTQHFIPIGQKTNDASIKKHLKLKGNT